MPALGQPVSPISNGLSNADYSTNFCARWSGGRNFLHHGQAGSEVSIEPDGSVYPCCIKTRVPLGSVVGIGLAQMQAFRREVEEDL